jgi:two-component system OmpR family response regulator
MPELSHLPRVLVVDDDPVTLRFFEGALSQLAECVVAGDGAAALANSATNAFDLFVIDLNLPDMRGEQLLDRLHVRHPSTRAIATSAEVDSDVRKRSVALGFDDVIEKPVALDRLLAVVGGYLRRNVPSTLLDDDAALQSLGGDRTSLNALRGLLVLELEALQKNYADSAAIDREELAARLHRLRASCGFCGATTLASAAASLQQSLHMSESIDRKAVDRFLELCDATATVLRS